MKEMNKQIEDMAKVIYASDILCHTCGESTYTYCADAIAEALYTAGYRKQSDTAREIFAEIEKRFEALLKQLPSNGKYESVKIFIDAHWDFIANSILKKYEEKTE